MMITADMAVIGNPYVHRYLATTTPHELIEEEDAAVA